MPRSRNNPPTVLPDDANSIRSTFYLSDVDNSPRVAFTFPNGAHFDHALSEYSTVTPAQKTALRNTLIALRNETFTLEGFV